MDHRAGAGPRLGADLLFFLRPEPLQTAHHLAPDAQAHHPAARRSRAHRRSRPARSVPSAGRPADQHEPLDPALRQPDHHLHRRAVEDGGPADRNRLRKAPHPHPVLHPQRRRNGPPPARRADRKGPRRGRGTHPLRRRGQQRGQKILFPQHAQRRHRGLRLPARQIPALHQQGQLPQPPQDRRHRRLRGLPRRHEHRRPLRPRHPMGHMARHPFPDRGQRRRCPRSGNGCRAMCPIGCRGRSGRRCSCRRGSPRSRR